MVSRSPGAKSVMVVQVWAVAALPAIEKEAIQPRAAGEEVGTQAAIEHIIARAAINGIIAGIGIDEIRPLGAQHDVSAGAAQLLVHQPQHGAGIEIGHEVAGRGIADFGVEYT